MIRLSSSPMDTEQSRMTSNGETEKDDLKPFVCTLAEAAKRNAGRQHPFPTVPALIETQARLIPAKYALGFPIAVSSNDWDLKTFTFRELQILTVAAGKYWRRLLGENGNEIRTVALLGSSVLPFLFSWLGLIYAGYTVLLLAPQNGAEAIHHLCRACETTTLIYQVKSKPLAMKACEAEKSASQIQIHEMPVDLKDFESLIAYKTQETPSGPPVSPSTTAYIHHSSGTSGGLPKPLPISHQMAVGVLPFPHGEIENFTTLSTTPLYHGGVADCFRSWTAGSMIWLFPGSSAVTCQNILKYAQDAAVTVQEEKTPIINYFSCVPQVLQIVVETSDGMEFLRKMEMVGVGGAAMPGGLANRLVHHGVNLVSRYGSTECGFLMSSDRNYKTDRAWDYLRQELSWPLKFEAQASGLSELVVLPTWPALKHHNRPDGSFATADLFEPHPELPRAWKYHSRADAQLTLITGKKFDAAPIEDAIRESPLIKDILIFGEGRPFPGALLFPADSTVKKKPTAMVNDLWQQIEAQNQNNPHHARLTKNMLVVMSEDAQPLQKSSKGTTLRKPAFKTYEKKIEAAYAAVGTSGGFEGDEKKSESYNDDQIGDVITSIIKDFVGLDMKPEDDFFDMGIESSAAIMIRSQLQRRLIPKAQPRLPFNVLYDCGTLSNLTAFIISHRFGQRKSTQLANEEEIGLMQKLVNTYGSWHETDARTGGRSEKMDGDLEQPEASEVILLTGATGILGAHLLAQLRARRPRPQIHCLVRGSTQAAARERVVKSLQQRQLPPLEVDDADVEVHPCRLSDKTLGLDQNVYSDLASRVTLVIHAAWAVNFTMRLSSFVKEHIAGLQNLINLALSPHRKQARPKVVFCSSMATVIGGKTGSLPPHAPEVVQFDPSLPSAMGYSRSKWVAEAICARAHQSTALHDRVKVLRIGQLCGDTERGVWNTTEAWPLMLSSSQQTKILPDLGVEKLDWLPVNVAAEAVLQIAKHPEKSRTASAELTLNGKEQKDHDRPCQAYNILNTSAETTWQNLHAWLKKLSPDVEIVPPAEWIAKLEILQDAGGGDSKTEHQHPALKLLDMWRRSYGQAVPHSGEEGTDEESKRTSDIHIETTKTKEAASVMRMVKPIDEVHFRKMWQWLLGAMEE